MDVPCQTWVFCALGSPSATLSWSEVPAWSFNSSSRSSTAQPRPQPRLRGSAEGDKVEHLKKLGPMGSSHPLGVSTGTGWKLSRLGLKNKCRPILVQGLRRDIEINFNINNIYCSVAQWISAWLWIWRTLVWFPVSEIFFHLNFF